MGAVTPFGLGVSELWSGLLSGSSAVTKLSSPDFAELPCRVAGQVVDFEPRVLLGRIEARRLSRFAQFALVAAREAWHQSDLRSANVDVARTAVIFGNGSGGLPNTPTDLRRWYEMGWKGLDSLGLLRALADSSTSSISIDLGLSGPTLTCVAACASGTIAIA